MSQPPVADAGNDITVKMPQDTVTLDGSKSSDDIEVIRYQWKQTSGENVNMQGKDEEKVTVGSLKGGEYVFTLTVFDADGQTDADDVKVIVKGIQLEKRRVNHYLYINILSYKRMLIKKRCKSYFCETKI